MLYLFLLSQALFAAVVPYKVELGTVDKSVVLSGTVEPLHSETIKVIGAFTYIRKPVVFPGQKVKKGDLIAETDTQYLGNEQQYLSGREELLKTQLEQTKIDEQYLLTKEERIRSLADREIIARNQVEAMELKVLDAKLNRQRSEVEWKELMRQKRENETKLKMSGFYSPIDGIVTELAVDPRKVTGTFLAAPGTRLARIDQAGEYTITAIGSDTNVTQLKAGDLGNVSFDGRTDSIPCELIEIKSSRILEKEGVPLFDFTFHFKQEGEILPRSIMARIEVSLKSREKPLIPWNALHIEPDKASVRVLNASNGWEERQVKLGVRGRHRVEVVSGIKAGDVVEAELW